MEKSHKNAMRIRTLIKEKILSSSFIKTELVKVIAVVLVILVLIMKYLLTSVQNYDRKQVFLYIIYIYYLYYYGLISQFLSQLIIEMLINSLYVSIPNNLIGFIISTT